MYKLKNSFSPSVELLAYETLFAKTKGDFISLTALFNKISPMTRLPSEVLDYEYNILNDLEKVKLDRLKKEVKDYLEPEQGTFSVLLNQSFQYPQVLRRFRRFPEVLYYQGDVGLLDAPLTSIIGSCASSPEQSGFSRRLIKEIILAKYVMLLDLSEKSNIAAAIKTIEEGGRIVAVLVTPINAYHSWEIRELQTTIAQKHLIISPVPFYQYNIEPPTEREKYVSMSRQIVSALSLGFVVGSF